MSTKSSDRRAASLTVVRALLYLSLGCALGMLAERFDLTGARAAEAQKTDAAVRTGQLEVVDRNGRRGIVMGTSAEGTPGMWFFDGKGRARLSIGLYEDGNASIVLNDEREQAVQIFRTVGPASDPVLVMKAEGRDRIVVGLHGASHDPFFVVYDETGKKESLFGSY